MAQVRGTAPFQKKGCHRVSILLRSWLELRGARRVLRNEGFRLCRSNLSKGVGARRFVLRWDWCFWQNRSAARRDYLPLKRDETFLRISGYPTMNLVLR